MSEPLLTEKEIALRDAIIRHRKAEMQSAGATPGQGAAPLVGTGSMVGALYVRIADMVWPAVTPQIAELEWKLRYSHASMTESDRLVVASIVAAYIQMVGDTQEKRNRVCKEISAASQRPNS